MESALLALTTKDATQTTPPTQLAVGKLVFEMSFEKALNSKISLYRFSFALDGGPPLDFRLAGNDSVNFFLMLDQILTPNQPNPHAMVLTTSDANGNPVGQIDIAVAVALQFDDGIHLYSYAFTPKGGRTLRFNLTSTDAGGMFGVYDDILWSNPPNPLH